MFVPLLQIDVNDPGATEIVLLGGATMTAGFLISLLVQLVKELKPDMSGKDVQLTCLLLSAAVAIMGIVSQWPEMDTPEGAMSVFATFVALTLTLNLLAKGIFHGFMTQGQTERTLRDALAKPELLTRVMAEMDQPPAAMVAAPPPAYATPAAYDRAVEHWTERGAPAHAMPTPDGGVMDPYAVAREEQRRAADVVRQIWEYAEGGPRWPGEYATQPPPDPERMQFGAPRLTAQEAAAMVATPERGDHTTAETGRGTPPG